MGRHFGLEIQFLCKDSSGTTIIVMVMFKESKSPSVKNGFLTSLGFGNKTIKKLKGGEKKTVGL